MTDRKALANNRNYYVWYVVLQAISFDLLGCVFVSPIHIYADTQKTVRSFFLFVAVLLRIRFVEFCKIGVFLARIPGYTLENDYFLSAYLFFCIRSTNSPSTWNSYLCVFGMCANTRTPKIAVFLSKICHVVCRQPIRQTTAVYNGQENLSALAPSTRLRSCVHRRRIMSLS